MIDEAFEGEKVIHCIDRLGNYERGHDLTYRLAMRDFDKT